MKAWLRLIRLPNSFTVVADGLAGMAVGCHAWQPVGLVVAICSALLCLYWAGMILNDVFDVEKDRRQHRLGPLVDGSLPLEKARRVGMALMCMGIAIPALAAWQYASSGQRSRQDPIVLQQTFQVGEAKYSLPVSQMGYTTEFKAAACSTPFIASAMAVCIWLYDGRLKATAFGPILMGLCRVGSLLLGMSIGWWLAPITPWHGSHFWMAAFGHGVYVMGITWAARREAESKQNFNLALGWICSAIGVAMLAAVCWLAPQRESLRISATSGYPIAIALFAMPWARRALRSVVAPSPQTIQAAVKQAILSIIFFDAMLTLQFAGSWQAMFVCSLILPAMLLGKWFRST
jgi:hypothetical protein